MSDTKRMLVAYMAHSTFTAAVHDYLIALKELPGFVVDYVDVQHGNELAVDLDSYDVVFNNFCARLIFDDYASVDYLEKLRRSKSLKILAVQDEYDNTNRLKEVIKQCKFDIVLTCVPQDSLSYVYPREEFPDVDFVTVFTGYVAVDFASKARKLQPVAERPIIVGYRGRDIGGRYGRMGFDKYEIGRRMKEICAENGVAHDIEMDEDSRIYGEAWFDFIGSCRAMLGTESGSNVFDFDGSIAKRFAQMKEEKGRTPSYEEFLPIVEQRDGEIEMGQISPRVFECAVMRTCMVLYRGRYSDALMPDEHYIALEKDFSNVDDVLKRIQNLDYVEKMTDRAYQHLVESGKFGYPALLSKISNAIEKRNQNRPQPPAPYVVSTDWRSSNPMKSWDRQPATSEPLPAKFYWYQRGQEKNAEYRALLRQFHRVFKTKSADHKRLAALIAKCAEGSEDEAVLSLKSSLPELLSELDVSETINELDSVLRHYDHAYSTIKAHDAIDTITEEEFREFESLNDNLMKDAVRFQQEWDAFDKRSRYFEAEAERALSKFLRFRVALMKEKAFRFSGKVYRRLARAFD